MGSDHGPKPGPWARARIMGQGQGRGQAEPSLIVDLYERRAQYANKT